MEPTADPASRGRTRQGCIGALDASGASPPPEQPYGSLDAILEAEIGETAAKATEVVKARASNPKVLLDGPGPMSKEEREVNAYEVSNTVGRSHGNNADYLTARIARDRPDVLDLLKRAHFSGLRLARG